MKHLKFIMGLLTLILILNITSGFGSAIDTIKAEHSDIQKIEKKKSVIDSLGTQANGDQKNTSSSTLKPINEYAILIITIFFFVVMLFLFYKLFSHLRDREQFIGFQSIKLIGLILMFPGICIIALAGGNLIGGSTLAALLGTIAGYVLSREDDPKDSSLKENNTKLKNEKEELDLTIKDLNVQIEALKKQIAG